MADYYITKYALTEGITKLSLPVEPPEDGYLSYIDNSDRWVHHFYTRKQWHLTRGEAEVRANQMRLAKIASLKKQIAKFEKLTFTEPTDADH